MDTLQDGIVAKIWKVRESCYNISLSGTEGYFLKPAKLTYSGTRIFPVLVNFSQPFQFVLCLFKLCHTSILLLFLCHGWEDRLPPGGERTSHTCYGPLIHLSILRKFYIQRAFTNQTQSRQYHINKIIQAYFIKNTCDTNHLKKKNLPQTVHHWKCIHQRNVHHTSHWKDIEPPKHRMSTNVDEKEILPAKHRMRTSVYVIKKKFYQPNIDWATLHLKTLMFL